MKDEGNQAWSKGQLQQELCLGSRRKMLQDSHNAQQHTNKE